MNSIRVPKYLTDKLIENGFNSIIKLTQSLVCNPILLLDEGNYITSLFSCTVNVLQKCAVVSKFQTKPQRILIIFYILFSCNNVTVYTIILYTALVSILQYMKCQYETINGGKYNTMRGGGQSKPVMCCSSAAKTEAQQKGR